MAFALCFVRTWRWLMAPKLACQRPGPSCRGPRLRPCRHVIVGGTGTLRQQIIRITDYTPQFGVKFTLVYQQIVPIARRHLVASRSSDSAGRVPRSYMRREHSDKGMAMKKERTVPASFVFLIPSTQVEEHIQTKQRATTAHA
ncbi:uncharacterized protein P884DRAFT_310596 [Thermothelomyces heterothallicus CBS 202.75]|uniref:uncharacterized protein n=1 Tax=Thermothelomyces heterothallicus CBS 202.75 TaxID=1149848 RepID=UPI0037425A85